MLSLIALAATSEGTPQLRRMWEGLMDINRRRAGGECYLTANNTVCGQKHNSLKEGLFYLFPLSEWQAAPTLASSLLQFDNTLQPKARGGEINHSKPL